MESNCFVVLEFHFCVAISCLYSIKRTDLDIFRSILSLLDHRSKFNDKALHSLVRQLHIEMEFRACDFICMKKNV